MIALVCIGIYANSLQNEFVYDDIQQIVENSAIRKLGNIPTFFSQDVWYHTSGRTSSNYYRPTMYVVYAVCYFLFDLRPWGFHLVSVLLHALAVVLVWKLSSVVLLSSTPTDVSGVRKAAFSGAMIFAVHPVNSEVVAWAAAIPELMFTVCGLAAVLVYIASAPLRPRPWHLIASAILILLALLSKETAAAIIPIIVVADIVVRHDRWIERLKRYLIFVFVLGVYVTVRVLILGSLAPLHNDRDPLDVVSNAIVVFWQYLRLLVAPFPLSAYHGVDRISSAADVRMWLALLLSGLGLAVVVLVGKKQPVTWMVFSLVTLPLLPVLYGPLLGSFSERYLYLSGAGLACLVSLAWYRVAGHRGLGRAATSALVLLVGVAIVATVHRNTAWRSEVSLWTDAISKYPAAGRPRYLLAEAYLRKGELVLAAEQFALASEFQPGWAAPHQGLGNVYERVGQLEAAIAEYHKAAVLAASLGTNTAAPGQIRERSQALLSVGNIYSRMGQRTRALEQYSKALQIDPGYADVYMALGIIHGEIGQLDDAIAYLARAIELAPFDPYMHHNLATAYKAQGRSLEAETHMARARALLTGR